MHAYPEFASDETTTMQKESDQLRKEVLIIGINWLGDSIMTMPAIQAYAKVFPEKRLIMLVKPKLAELWEMHPAINEVWASTAKSYEILRLASRIRQRRFAAAFILPNSFRSALIPFLGRIPERLGLRGHYRKCLLTKIIFPPQGPDNLHQQYEYLAVFGEKNDKEELPCLRIPDSCLDKAHALLGGNKRWVGLVPGAARGPAKRWPAEYFSALGKSLQSKHGCNIVLFGAETDIELCAQISSSAGKAALNLAGRTSLPELAALFSRCSAVIGNDSGGIHLAAAAGAPVIGIFGFTDPARTRPLGRKVIILQDSERRARDITRNSIEAQKILKKISPGLVEESFGKITGNC